MPIYEYRCGACGFQKEFLQKLSDAPLKDCPECGKVSLSKMVTAAGFQLKGSGWYATDFKTQAKAADKPEAKSDDKVSAKSEDKSAAKTDAKPAADAPAKKVDVPAATSTPAATPAASS